MAEITVSEDEGEDLEEGAAHAAAVHEGAAQVHEERAEEAAGAAAAAASLAAAAAEENAASIGDAEVYAVRAEEAAGVASAAALACAQAVEALTGALQSHTEELRLQDEAQKQPKMPAEPAKKTPDKSPSPPRKRSFGERYYGG